VKSERGGRMFVKFPTSLYNLGLQVLEQGNNFVVVGEDIFNKKDSIKACGFRWDASHKLWYLPKEQQAA